MSIPRSTRLPASGNLRRFGHASLAVAAAYTYSGTPMMHDEPPGSHFNETEFAPRSNAGPATSPTSVGFATGPAWSRRRNVSSGIGG
eukprot:9473086-Pyramimonas_sp.AAC.1